MVYFEAKNTGDAKASARLFNTEIGLFGATRSGSAQFTRIIVEISSLTESQVGRFRLNSEKLVSCAGQFPLESRP